MQASGHLMKYPLSPANIIMVLSNFLFFKGFDNHPYPIVNRSNRAHFIWYDGCNRALPPVIRPFLMLTQKREGFTCKLSLSHPVTEF